MLLVGLAGRVNGAKPSREFLRDSYRDGRLRLEELPKPPPRDRERDDRPVGHNRSRAETSVEQSKLADEVPGAHSQRGAAGYLDGDLTAEDDEELAGGLTAHHEGCAVGESPDACGFRDFAAVPLVESREERNR